jgi:hypothetical protein
MQPGIVPVVRRSRHFSEFPACDWISWTYCYIWDLVSWTTWSACLWVLRTIVWGVQMQDNQPGRSLSFVRMFLRFNLL